VAIACQGGGSHTAFTAGVLKRLFASGGLDPAQVVALSGTSGGAVCALVAWNSLITGRSDGIGPALEAFWDDNAASSPGQQVLNQLGLWAAELNNAGLMPAVSPYQSPFSVTGADQFRSLLRSHVDFDAIEVDEVGERPMLLLGAVDVLSGEFRAFNSRQDRITPDTVLASAAIPTLFCTVHLEGGAYWDGLFSQNPPVHDLLAAEPDEVWVIQINPQRWDTEPTTLAEIADRRNELSGNLSLYQELSFIETIDGLLESGILQSGGKYRQIVVRVIELSRSALPSPPRPGSKLNRDPAFLRGLIAHGEEQADEFLAALAFEQAWKEGDPDLLVSSFCDRAEITAERPFPGAGRYEGHAQIRAFFRQLTAGPVELDLTRKQVAGDGVVWTFRVRGGDESPPVPGRAEANFEGGLVSRLSLTAPR
jgi:NTE family protein